ncbi:hypothetical protein IMSAGC014_01509 [Bacteroidaceae bacterium]|nr:hypothetical protein IMSAGC014_01509 [Bacteroidaceae bacterium]
MHRVFGLTLKIPVLQFKFQVFVLKFRYGLFQFQCLK